MPVYNLKNFKHFNDEKKVYLVIDASIMGLGTFLDQPFENNILYPNISNGYALCI